MITTVINFGLGNIASVSNMIRKVGGEANVCNTPDNLRYAEKILLPGVGSFTCLIHLFLQEPED
jgi:glutamine amidotransferase